MSTDTDSRTEKNPNYWDATAHAEAMEWLEKSEFGRGLVMGQRSPAVTAFRAGWLKHKAGQRDAQQAEVSMGVGTGDTGLFVHGPYDAIKAAQAIVLSRDKLRTELQASAEEIARLKAEIAEWQEENS